MRNKQETDSIADAHMRAMMTGNIGLLDSLLSSDFILSYNISDTEIPKSQALEIAAALSKDFPDLCYRNVRRYYIDDGYIQRHVITGRKADGTEFRVPGCFFATIRDGQLTRLDEYFDSAHDPRN